MTNTHPDARCGDCHACRHVEATRKIVLAHSAPAGPGIKQGQTDLWNETLEENSCLHPLVLVYHDRQTVTGRVMNRHIAKDSDKVVLVEVMTAHFGEINVYPDKIEPWTPETSLNRIRFEVLVANLKRMPATFYPGLLAAVYEGAADANTFMPFGASAMIQRMEAQRLAAKEAADCPPAPRLGEEFVSARACLYADAVLASLRRLRNCPDLNEESLDDVTLDALADADRVLGFIDAGLGDPPEGK